MHGSRVTVTLPWRTGSPSHKGDYIVVDKSYRFLSVAYYSPELGWCINGRWLGHDAVELWQDAPPIPERRT